MPEPSKIPNAWAWNGDINNIPDLDPGNGLASWELGYPIETQIPIAAGGTPPRRQDMNGALNALSNAQLWYQQGGLWEYDAYTDYEVGNHILQNGSLYYCIAANGPSGTIKSPANDTAGTYWKPIIYANGRHPDPDHLLAPAVLQVLQAVYPVGSIYCSYESTSPATLFGFGSWTKIEGRFLLGANSTYSLGSIGGSATVALTVAQLPAHSHSASSASAGAHRHTITINSGGAHTHSASSASAGNHTHTRGTMEITGSLITSDNEPLFLADGITASGALKNTNIRSAPYITGGGGSGSFGLDFTASKSWTGATSSNGAHTHTITVNSGGAHTHGASSANAGAHTHSITVSNTGSGQAHSNMPPYLAVNMWRRTA